jgi:hypothetical protein
MKLFNLFTVLMVSLSFGIFTACNKECADCPGQAPSADVSKPGISVVSPSMNTSYTGGDTISFHAWFTDNRELSQYRVEIHSSSDGHAHGKNSEIAPFFEYSTTVNITGVNTEQRLFIPIPTSAAAGPYHFIVSAVDKAGNEANFVEVDLNITNPSDTVAPLVTPVYPDFSATEVFTVFPTGQDTVQVRIIGQLTDAGNGGSTGNLKGYLVEFHEEGSNEVIYQLSNSNLSGAIENMNLTLVLRRSDMINEKYYTLKVKAFDHSNNSSYKEVRYKTVLN